MKQKFNVPTRVRGDVAYFAALMEQKLHENYSQSGWEKLNLLWSQVKLIEKTGKLAETLAPLHVPIKGETYNLDGEKQQAEVEKAIWEAVDVAVWALALANTLSERLK